MYVYRMIAIVFTCESMMSAGGMCVSMTRKKIGSTHSNEVRSRVTQFSGGPRGVRCTRITHLPIIVFIAGDKTDNLLENLEEKLEAMKVRGVCVCVCESRVCVGAGRGGADRSSQSTKVFAFGLI